MSRSPLLFALVTALVVGATFVLGACQQLAGIGDLPGLQPEAGRDGPGDAGAAPPDVTKQDASDASTRDVAPNDARADALDGFPSHTQSAFYMADAGPLTGVAVIDTFALTVTLTDGGTLSGLSFVLDEGSVNAVLSVGSWDVESNVVVVGQNSPLIVVAAGPITVNATITAAAVGSTAGPGAVTTSGLAGVGTSGCSATDPTGGAGGGFGTAGALGGSSGPSSCTNLGGRVFGAMEADFTGGASGGAGSMTCGSGSGNSGAAGAGGGAIQLSSAVSITVTAAGGISVGGGGGQGGCGGSTGAGGGAGGMIFLEAPVVDVAGQLAANGGGGGTGDSCDSVSNGIPGADGTLGVVPAKGGSGGSDYLSGGAGAAGKVDAAAGQGGGGCPPAGGGGGLGRYWFRTRKAPAQTTGAVLSGSPGVDTSL